MTKEEFELMCKHFPGEIEIEVLDSQGYCLDIKHANYTIDEDGDGKIVLVPMGSHIPKGEEDKWVELRI